jgi:Flp pilus assembly pilin Flp
MEKKERKMKYVIKAAMRLQIWKDNRGQDLIEYAMMAGFVAVAAGAVMPGVSSSVNVIFSKVNSVMVKAASS